MPDMPKAEYIPPKMTKLELVPEGYRIVAFAPCVPFKSLDDDIEQGIVDLGNRKLCDPRTGAPATAELSPDFTLTITLPNGRKQIYPKGLASVLLEKVE